MLFLQDVVLTVPPYPYSVEESSDVPLEKCWVARPQLFFTCYLRPRGGRPPKRANYTYGADDIQVQLVFYSTFEPVVLPGSGPMDTTPVQKLYEPSPTPILYVGLAADVLGRVPLMPLFLLGNSTPTIPHQLRQHRRSKFPHAEADAADASGKKGSNVYELNQWLWRFGRGKPRLGGLSVAESEDRRIAVKQDGGRRGHETWVRRNRKAPKEAAAHA